MPVKTLISKLLPVFVADIPKPKNEIFCYRYLRKFSFDVPGYVPVVPTFSTATSYCGASGALKRQPIRHFLIEASLLRVIYI
jgi:hypothetical protein